MAALHARRHVHYLLNLSNLVLGLLVKEGLLGAASLCADVPSSQQL